VANVTEAVQLAKKVSLLIVFIKVSVPNSGYYSGVGSGKKRLKRVPYTIL